jgi:hypothetical protein
MDRHYYTAHATLTLMNGQKVQHQIKDFIRASSRGEAASYAPRIVADLIADLDCETIDAPIDIFTIDRIEWEA